MRESRTGSFVQTPDVRGGFGFDIRPLHKLDLPAYYYLVWIALWGFQKKGRRMIWLRLGNGGYGNRLEKQVRPVCPYSWQDRHCGRMVWLARTGHERRGNSRDAGHKPKHGRVYRAQVPGGRGSRPAVPEAAPWRAAGFRRLDRRGAYLLGVLWGRTSVGSDRSFWVRHRDKWYPEAVKSWLGITAGIREVSSGTGRQYRLKVSRAADIATLENIFARYGWSPRNAPRRPYPAGEVDDRGFIRAWVELHSSYDMAAMRLTKTLRPRLRIYGNYELLNEVNWMLAAACGVGLRKLQKAPSTTTKIIYYVGESCRAVLAWLYHGAGLFNPRSKLLEGLPPAGRSVGST